MNEEIDAIEKNHMQDFVDIPIDKTSIGVKWVYKTKLNEKGELEKHKESSISKGYAQQYGVDYDETLLQQGWIPSELFMPLQHKISGMFIKWA